MSDDDLHSQPLPIGYVPPPLAVSSSAAAIDPQWDGFVNDGWLNPQVSTVSFVRNTFVLSGFNSAHIEHVSINVTARNSSNFITPLDDLAFEPRQHVSDHRLYDAPDSSPISIAPTQLRPIMPATSLNAVIDVQTNISATSKRYECEPAMLTSELENQKDNMQTMMQAEEANFDVLNAVDGGARFPTPSDEANAVVRL
jgi:hypothetical protein